MTNPPDDFLPPSDLRVYYEHRQGTHGDYHWLQSRAFKLLDFFKWVAPPQGGFRLIVTSFDGAEGGGPFLTLPGWENEHSFAISPLLHTWPVIVPTGNGESTLVFDVQADMLRVKRKLASFNDVGYMEQLDDMSLVTVSKFWTVLESIQPLHYVDANGQFSMTTRSKESFDSFISHPKFTGHKAKFIKAANILRTEIWTDHAQRLGPECGPEKCKEEGCQKLRIQVAVRCIEHQLRRFDPGSFHI